MPRSDVLMKSAYVPRRKLATRLELGEGGTLALGRTTFSAAVWHASGLLADHNPDAISPQMSSR